MGADIAVCVPPAEHQRGVRQLGVARLRVCTARQGRCHPDSLLSLHGSHLRRRWRDAGGLLALHL